MTVRLLDEVFSAGEKGVLLLSYQEDAPFAEGARLRDALGAEHEIMMVSRQEDIITLLVKGGDRPYFERLFRNVYVDATAFELAVDAGEG